MFSFFSSFWAQQNPFWTIPANAAFPKKVMTWTGVLDNQLFGPYFFDDHVNFETYLYMLENFLLNDLTARDIDPKTIWYAHDGAPSHNAAEVRMFLTRNFEAWIGPGEGARILWPANSPDFNPLDYFIWSYMKNIIAKEEYQSLDQLRNKIQEVSTIIRQNDIRNSTQSIIRRIHLCIEQNGLHFEQLIR